MVKGNQLLVVMVAIVFAISWFSTIEAKLRYQEPHFPVYNFTEFLKCDKIFKENAGLSFMECSTGIVEQFLEDTFSFSPACCKAENAISNLPCWKDSVEYFSPVFPKWYSTLIKDYCASGKAPLPVLIDPYVTPTTPAPTPF
ncbi:hypothetical protein H6P81_014742 [Aristolochia fimbriata]|uniref:Prolamin-like domain-containing protein n=1 Tax=Aristolochia fimbriata TaxID=158543 RepID=A0AAV7E6G3_ARIFI|nr:hypothetical protein H6P81_014742 [Aristolochia fimbriata]